MSDQRCKFVCVAAAILAAIIVGYYGGLAIGLGEPLSVILAAVIGAALWWKLPDWFCPSSEEKTGTQTTGAGMNSTGARPAAKAPETTAAAKADKTAAAGAASGSGAHWSSDVKQDSGATSDARGQTGIKPSAELAEEATLRDGVGSWKYGEGGASTKAGAAAGVKPPTLSAPRDGGADDLKRIKGVGPKMETTLNEMGFHHFDQIAAWSSDHVAWVDANLEGFNGRVSRDDWVGQAAALASGRET